MTSPFLGHDQALQVSLPALPLIMAKLVHPVDIQAGKMLLDVPPKV